MKAAAWYGAKQIFCPPQYLAGKDQIFRNSVRDRQDLEDLKIKAKPKTRTKSRASKPRKHWPLREKGATASKKRRS